MTVSHPGPIFDLSSSFVSRSSGPGSDRQGRSHLALIDFSSLRPSACPNFEAPDTPQPQGGYRTRVGACDWSSETVVLYQIPPTYEVPNLAPSTRPWTLLGSDLRRPSVETTPKRGRYQSRKEQQTGRVGLKRRLIESYTGKG